MSYHQGGGGGGGGPDQWGSGGGAPPYGGGAPAAYGGAPAPPPGGYPNAYGAAPPPAGYPSTHGAPSAPGGYPPPGGAPPVGYPPHGGGGAPAAYGDPYGHAAGAAPGGYAQAPPPWKGAYGQPPPPPHAGYGPPPGGAYGPPPGPGQGAYGAAPPPYGGAYVAAPPAPAYGGGPAGYPPPGDGYPPPLGGAGGNAERFLGHGTSHYVANRPAAPSLFGARVARGEHLFNTRQTFTVKEKIASLSGDSFDIKDAAGSTRYKVDAKFLTAHQRKRLIAASGEALLGLSQSQLSLRDRMTVTDSTGRPAVTLLRRGFMPGAGHSTVFAWWGTKTDEVAPFLEIKAGLLKWDFKLTEVGGEKRPVATVKRDVATVKNFFTDRDDFTLWVEPNYDCAFLVMVVVVLDEMFSDDN